MAATFFMVSGGTYGTEDIIHGAGYGLGILLLLLTPLIWSLPTTLYDWRAFRGASSGRRFLRLGSTRSWEISGDFKKHGSRWSPASSIWRSIPRLFVAYLSRLIPWFGVGHRGVMVGLGVVTVCALMNIAGIRVVATTSLWLFFLLSAPFALIILIAPTKMGALSGVTTCPTTSTVGLVGGLLICMWNYMGWDNASTIATEVKRPQRTYPRAMLVAVAVVSLSYVLPFAAMWLTGVPSSAFETGSWADLAGMMGGLVGGPLVARGFRVALVLGGMMSAFGMFNALVMSYSRLPLAMSQDGMLPAVFQKLHPKTRAPWVAIVVCAAGWAMCLGLGFERLVTIDILLYGMSLTLEFVALVALRIKEPNLRRPFRVPGGLPGAILIGSVSRVAAGLRYGSRRIRTYFWHERACLWIPSDYRRIFGLLGKNRGEERRLGRHRHQAAQGCLAFPLTANSTASL